MKTRVSSWACSHGTVLLRVSLGVVFLWFGALKFFPHLCAAQDLATRTIDKLTLGFLPPSVSLLVLAVWECAIGISLLSGMYTRTALLLFFFQMSGTLTSVFFFPQEMFIVVPYAPTLEGQYVIKNLVLISAGVVLGGALRNDKEAHGSAASPRAPLISYRIPGRRWNDFAYQRRFAVRRASLVREVRGESGSTPDRVGRRSMP
jgi:uncharacterized membrane protein YphA (DoxX/SURF4 family)